MVGARDRGATISRVNYADAVEYLRSFNDLERGVQFSANPVMSLASMRSLLARLNDPHLGRATVHVTGSKGKGSTAAMIAGILREAGRTTAVYSSPHLHSFTERITIDGVRVSREEFAAGFGAIRPALDAERDSGMHGELSTFGVLTALFFWLVRAQARRVEWQVVEVGLGGTFDATNVFEASELAVITPISLEHTAILGDTTAKIATDKAGIVKPGATCVLAPQRDPDVLDVVRQRCEEAGAQLVEVGVTCSTELLEQHPWGQAFVLIHDGEVRRLRAQMLGRHQLDNAATAVMAALALRERGVELPESAIADGIARTRLPGRMEVMGQRPLIVADGAHNGESAAALAATLRDAFEWRRCFLVLGTAKDKDLAAIAGQLARMAELIVCCGYASPRAMDPEMMVQEVGALGPAAVAEPTVAAAIETALSHAHAEDLVCITGSLYVVAEARRHLLLEGATGE